jgi:hypothetical protein
MSLSPDILSAALAGLEEQRNRLERQIAEVRSLMGRRGPGRPPKAQVDGGQPTEAGVPVKRKRRKWKMSAEARARIAAAQKRRWAAKKKH